MKFQMLKLIVWPKDTAFPPREVEFKPGVLNVITGASRTGKSAIIPIIDYCLASSDCHIPIDTIRDHASWYGIVAETSSGLLLLARRVPVGTKASNEFFMLTGEAVSVPPTIPEPKQTLADVKHYLNALADTPSFKLNEEDEGYTGRLGFRDIVALSFQSQDIIANQNILFYKTHSHEHRERLRNWFPYILGVETLDTLRARHKLKVIEIELRRLKKEHAQARVLSDSWLANLKGHLRLADEYGLLHESIPADACVPDLLRIANAVVENPRSSANTEVDNIERANADIARLESEDEELSLRIGELKKRLSDLTRVSEGFQAYRGTSRKRADRLHIAKWLRDVSENTTSCPACGSMDHPRADEELTHICAALETNEANANALVDIPSTFVREEVRLQEELEEALGKKKVLSERFDLVTARDREAQREVHRRQEMHMFLGHLSASLEMIENLADEGDLASRIRVLEENAQEFRDIVSAENVRRGVDAATAKIAQGALEHLKTLDVEAKYRRVAPRFSVKELAISVLSDDGNWHFLAEVGSASNWVSFHLALICALEEYFIALPKGVAPSFAIFDQPSQVYFPRAKPLDGPVDDDPGYERDEDTEAVKSMFNTLAGSVSASGGRWQAIVLEHADSSIYGDIEGVHQVEEWRQGQKLIPEAWYCEGGIGVSPKAPIETGKE